MTIATLPTTPAQDDDPVAIAAIVLRAEPKVDDLDAVRALVKGTDYFRPDEVDVAVELLAERLKNGVSSGYFFVFADETDASGVSVLRGYSCYGPIACTIGSFDLFWIAVDTRHQGRGLGRLLLSETEANVRAAGGRRLYAETSGQSGYASTRHFYQSCGYRQEAEFIDFYDMGESKIVFGKAVGGGEVADRKVVGSCSDNDT